MATDPDLVKMSLGELWNEVERLRDHKAELEKELLKYRTPNFSGHVSNIERRNEFLTTVLREILDKLKTVAEEPKP